MSVDKVFQSAQRQKPIGQYIPPGIKENVFFVIDDTYNYQRRLSKKQSAVGISNTEKASSSDISDEGDERLFEGTYTNRHDRKKKK
jgi:hypothetical protein